MQLRRETCVRVWWAALLVLAMAGLTTAAPAMLPSGWSSRDIGLVGTRGQALNRGGAFVLRGAGTSVGERSDSFQFAYRLLRGDGEIVARVSNVGGASPAAAGVMLRESLLATSRFVYLRAGAAAAAFQQRGAVTAAAEVARTGTLPAEARRTTSSIAATRPRTSTSTTPTSSATTSKQAVSRSTPDTSNPSSASNSSFPSVSSAVPATPAIAEARSESRPTATGNVAVTSEFVRLIRKGNRVSAYRSVNGVSWTLVGSEEVPMASTISRWTRRHHANGWRARDRHI